MASEKPFVSALSYFQALGVYDVVLPFLLIFALTYAVLDKTRILGTETVGSVEYPKKNVNAIVALVIAFFTLASSRVLQIITELSQWVTLTLFSFFLFMMLVGSFYSEEELKKGLKLSKGWKIAFTFLSLGLVVFFVIFFIITSFTDAAAIGKAMGSWFNEDTLSMIVLLGLIVAAIVVVMMSGKSKGSQS
ncbi:MAG: hypothetical protein GWP09_01495 [Nitrospiraceae bacterium]|nr:hypothetical protein [Nitrospiraceae bacterium]